MDCIFPGRNGARPIWINSLRPRPNRRHFADDIFKCIFGNENEWISPRISRKFVPKVRINNIQALVQIMACRLDGAKPLSEPMMVRLPTHLCVARPQWVNIDNHFSKYHAIGDFLFVLFCILFVIVVVMLCFACSFVCLFVYILVFVCLLFILLSLFSTVAARQTLSFPYELQKMRCHQENRRHAGGSKRPTTERTLNFREMERPIYHFLIEMVHEEVGVSFWS